MFAEAILDLFDGPHNASTRKIAFEANDWYDLAQLRYLGTKRRWVTRDRVWVDVARRAGIADRVLLAA
jgi:hypothetical protein